MSYTQTFNAAFSLTGANAKDIVYSLCLVPPTNSKSEYGRAFHSALNVRILSAIAQVTVIPQAADAATPTASAAFGSDNLDPKTVHDVAAGGKFLSPGATVSLNLSDAVGLQTCVKGEVDLGDEPSLYIAYRSEFDTDKKNVVTVHLQIKAEFSGQSSATFFNQAFAGMT